jgi:hypothetical protein
MVDCIRGGVNLYHSSSSLGFSGRRPRKSGRQSPDASLRRLALGRRIAGQRHDTDVKWTGSAPARSGTWPRTNTILRWPAVECPWVLSSPGEIRRALPAYQHWNEQLRALWSSATVPVPRRRECIPKLSYYRKHIKGLIL